MPWPPVGTPADSPSPCAQDIGNLGGSCSARPSKPPSLGSVCYENKINERGERLIWLDHSVVARLRAMRGPGESYSDVILRIAESVV
jgi:hypothetical protein